MRTPNTPALTNGGHTRVKTTPIPLQKTARPQELRTLTSMPAGKMVPLAAIPLLREDSLPGAQIQIAFEQMETVEILMNAVNVRVLAYLVPNLAHERFGGSMDVLNRSYMGQAPYEGAAVVPFFDTMAAPAHGANDILTYMGAHFKPGDTINTAYIEAYNLIWNLRAKNRSPDITLRDRLDTDLAPAFWLHQNFAHIVPDFDQGIIDGEVPLGIANAKMPVKGIGYGGATASTLLTPVVMKESGETTPTSYAGGGHVVIDPNTTLGAGMTTLNVKANGAGYPDVWAELQDTGITMSMANIEMVRKTQAFAELRRQYNGHSEEWIIDMLMQGLSIADEAWKQPQLLADQRTVMGMAKRYASDAGNLTESVVNGGTSIPLRFSVPRVPCGGVIMIVAEIMPDQLFERQLDPYLYADNVEADLPNALRDMLDPEKVQIVVNREVDIDHATPTATFGYAPLNHQWMRSIPRIGGKFYRPEVDAAFDEDRQRIWAEETANPVLSSEFYLCGEMHLKPFVVTNQDPFEAMLRGTAIVRGNTVFGGHLVEATNDFDKVMAQAPTERINKDAAP